MDIFDDLDLGDRSTQLMLAGGALLAGLVVARLRGGGAHEGPDAAQFVIEAPPTVESANPSPWPGWASPPPNPNPATPTPDPGDGDGAWEFESNTEGLPYTCPIGSRMARSRFGVGHVCIDLVSGVAFEVEAKPTTPTTPTNPTPTNPSQPWTPAPPAPKRNRPADTPQQQATGEAIAANLGGLPAGLPYTCPDGAHFARDGSGQPVCRWQDGRTTPVVWKSTMPGQGIGGDAPTGAFVPGIPSDGGVPVMSPPIHVATEHTVRAGDTLVGLAGHYLGDTRRWPMILDVNPELRGLDELRSGQRLRLP